MPDKRLKPQYEEWGQHIMDYLQRLVSSGWAATAVLAAWFAAWYAGAPEMVQRLLPAALGLIVLDTLLGGAVAWKAKEFSSSQIIKAFEKLILYSAAGLAMLFFDWGLGLGYYCILSLLALIVYRDGMSVLENLSVLGLPLPFVKERLAKWNEKQAEDTEEE